MPSCGRGYLLCCDRRTCLDRCDSSAGRMVFLLSGRMGPDRRVGWLVVRSGVENRVELSSVPGRPLDENFIMIKAAHGTRGLHSPKRS